MKTPTTADKIALGVKMLFKNAERTEGAILLGDRIALETFVEKVAFTNIKDLKRKRDEHDTQELTSGKHRKLQRTDANDTSSNAQMRLSNQRKINDSSNSDSDLRQEIAKKVDRILTAEREVSKLTISDGSLLSTSIEVIKENLQSYKVIQLEAISSIILCLI